MLRIILLIGNIGLLISSFVLFMEYSSYRNIDTVKIICFIVFMLLALLNIYFVRAIYSGSISLSIKRKNLEEEIKIQEAENKLKELQSQRSDS